MVFSRIWLGGVTSQHDIAEFVADCRSGVNSLSSDGCQKKGSDLDERLFFYLAGVPALGIAAQWLAWRLRLPSILLLLAFGVALRFVVDPDSLIRDLANIPKDVDAKNPLGPKVIFPFVSLSVAVVLFEGGLTLRLNELKTAGVAVLRLCTLGVVISWVLGGIAACYVVGLPPSIGALIGAILVVTGPTVIAPLLRHIKPTRRVGSIAKWEGIVVDPIGAILAVLVFQFITGEAAQFAFVLFRTTAAGCILGLGGGMILVQLLKRFWVPDYLHGVTFLAVTLSAFAISNGIQSESGLVTVTLLGVYLANQKEVSLRHIIEFKEHLTVLLISCLFIVLGSRLDPKALVDVGLGGIAFVAILIGVVRPASVFLSTIRSDVNLAERAFLAFLAPRGIVAAAVTAVFALEIQHLIHENESLAHLAQPASKLEALTFMVIVGTVAFYGLLAGPLARWLKLADAKPQGILFAGAEPWIRNIALSVQEEGFQVVLVDTNYRNIAAAKMAGLPAACYSILSERAHEELDFGGIGRLLAATPNDEVNSLAASEFVHQFGRANVYQLPPWDAGIGHRDSVSEHLRGRLLFGDGLHHDKLANLMTHGHEVKKTRLSDEFTYDQFCEMYGDSAVVLFLIDEAKNLIVRTDEDTTAPSAGQTVIALVNPPATEMESD